jgi:hypothetical protein
VNYKIGTFLGLPARANTEIEANLPGVSQTAFLLGASLFLLWNLHVLAVTLAEQVYGLFPSLLQHRRSAQRTSASDGEFSESGM